MIQITIAGYVGQDAKVIDSCCVFNIAHTERSYTKQDQTVVPEKTTWYSVFYKNDKIADYIKKGSYLVINANNLSAKIYNDSVQLSCNALNVEFGGSKN